MSRIERGAAPPTPAPADAAPSPEAAVDEATAQLDAMERRADRRPTLNTKPVWTSQEHVDYIKEKSTFS